MSQIPARERVAQEDQGLIISLSSQTLLPGGCRGTSSGMLLFGRGATLFDVGFDAGRRPIVGEPVPILENVTSLLNRYMAYDVSDDGTRRTSRSSRVQQPPSSESSSGLLQDLAGSWPARLNCA